MIFGRLESLETIPAWRPDGININISISIKFGEVVDRRKGRGPESSGLITIPGSQFYQN